MGIVTIGDFQSISR